MSAEPPCDDLANLSDRELLERIRAGSEAAARALFDRYYVRLVRYVGDKMGARLQSVEPPSELAHSALKSVLLGIPAREFDVDQGGSLWPLLVTVALNKIRNRWRKHTGPSKDIRRNVPLHEYQLLVNSQDQQSETELKDLVEQLLGTFSGRRRRIIELFLQGYRTGEIAGELGISERTVYSTRQRAIGSLRELLDRERPS